MQKRARAHGLVVRHGDRPDRGANARPNQAQPPVSLLSEPEQAAARVRDGLARGLNRESDVRTNQLIGPLMPRRDAVIVVRQREAQDADAELRQPAAEVDLAVPLGVPVGQQNDGGPG